MLEPSLRHRYRRFLNQFCRRNIKGALDIQTSYPQFNLCWRSAQMKSHWRLTSSGIAIGLKRSTYGFHTKSGRKRKKDQELWLLVGGLVLQKPGKLTENRISDCSTKRIIAQVISSTVCICKQVLVTAWSSFPYLQNFRPDSEFLG